MNGVVNCKWISSNCWCKILVNWHSNNNNNKNNNNNNKNNDNNSNNNNNDNNNNNNNVTYFDSFGVEKIPKEKNSQKTKI